MSNMENVIYCGDCKDVLVTFPDESIDLIVIDPPFFSNKNYEIIWKDGYEIRSFEDRWLGGIEHYVSWMEERIRQCYRVLKKTGSIYLHVDWHASHYLKVMMDRIFGYKNFQNEIIWHYGLGGSSPRRWQRKHDNILFYTKSDKWIFNPIMVPATSMRMKGELKKEDDVWDIPTINNMSKERLGYPTQKPEKLLERIILASSNPGDLVLDPMCGCGTTITVAEKLERKWIGIDVSPSACRLMTERLRKVGVNIGENDIIGLPRSIDELRSLKPFEFQNWVCRQLGGRVNPKKSSDMGIDGWLFDGTPIQVKQSNRVGREIIDSFETAVRRSRKTKGVVVAFGFSKGAYEEVARVKMEEKIDIELLTIGDLIEEEG